MSKECVDKCEMIIIEPNEEIVHKFNSWWKNGCDDVSMKDILGIECEGKAKEKGIVFSEIKRGEEILDSVFEKLKNGKITETEKAVILLDCIYHTQIKNVTHFAIVLREHLESEEGRKMFSKIADANTPKEKADCVDKIASLVKKKEGGNYAYSFATKFCNRINPNKYPIFDGYVGWLLKYYNHENKENFGKYDSFVEEYKTFKEKFKLTECSYKELDVFLWTYGKALNIMYPECKAHKSVDYKEPN